VYTFDSREVEKLIPESAMRKSALIVLVFLATSLLIVEKPRTPLARDAGGARIAGSGGSESPASPTRGQTVFYVATDGNDAWSGKLAKANSSRTNGPFRTIERAQKAVRELKAAGPLQQPVTVYIRGGRHDLARPLVFTPKDSGTPQDPVTYAAYHGERPVLSGGRAITGWKQVTDPKLVSQAGGELWQVRLPAVKEGKWYFRELFVNGHRRPRARTPNTGFFHVDGEINLVRQASSRPRVNSKFRFWGQATFRFRPGDIQPRWAAQGNVNLVVLAGWQDSHLYIRHVDAATHTVTLSGPTLRSMTEHNSRYWVENTLDALDAPGEWYLDRASGVLYYRSEPGEKMEDVQAIAPVLEQLVLFKGTGETGPVHNIRLCGLTLSYTDWSMGPNGYAGSQTAYNIPSAVSGMGTRSLEIERCVFRHLGGYAVHFGGGATRRLPILRGSKDDRIIGNDMYDLGAGGVKIGDPRNPQTDDQVTSGNIVSDNHIHDIGAVYLGSTGIWVGLSSNNTLSHNEINDTYECGISVGWVWGFGPSAAKDNIIEYNNIYNIGRGMLSDMGCIYTLGVQPGTVERNNLCHDVTRYRLGYGGWGIYTDEGSSDILIENNVVYRAEDGGFHQNYGKNNTLINNIFAYGKTYQLAQTREERQLNITFEHNIVYWDHGPLLQGIWDNNLYHFDHNLYYRTDGRPIQFDTYSFTEWQARGQDTHSLIADPLFVDPAGGDFSLKPGSPALEIGFKPIDLSQVGPRTVQH
jgi:parallel beta-helix repeat protein